MKLLHRSCLFKQLATNFSEAHRKHDRFRADSLAMETAPQKQHRTGSRVNKVLLEALVE